MGCYYSYSLPEQGTISFQAKQGEVHERRGYCNSWIHARLAYCCYVGTCLHNVCWQACNTSGIIARNTTSCQLTTKPCTQWEDYSQGWELLHTKQKGLTINYPSPTVSFWWAYLFRTARPHQIYFSCRLPRSNQV